jgi:hypothetical protein
LGISDVKVTGWENRMERKARTGWTIFRDLAFCNLGLIKETSDRHGSSSTLLRMSGCAV